MLNLDLYSRIKLGFTFILVLAGLFLFSDGFVSVPAGHSAVIYDRGRGVLDKELDPGLHLKIPFWQKATILDMRLQTFTMSITPGEGEQYGNDAIEALTKDGQKIDMDVSIQYRLEKGKAPIVYEKIGIYYPAKIVRPFARSVVREIATNFNSKELFQMETRKKAEERMKEVLTEKFKTNSIVLIDVLLRNIRFSEIYINAIEEKQIAEQKIEKAQYEMEEAKIRKEKKIIEAEAEAESIRVKGEALSDNPSVIQFEFVQKLAPSINWGVMPNDIIPMLNLGQR